MSKLYHDGEEYEIQDCEVYYREKDDEVDTDVARETQDTVAQFVLDQDPTESLVRALDEPEGELFQVTVAGLEYAIEPHDSTFVAGEQSAPEVQVRQDAEPEAYIQVALIAKRKNVYVSAA